MSLVRVSQAGPLVGCRDGRTARKRLAALGVAVVTFDGGEYVDESEVLRALRAHQRPLEGGAPTRPAGFTLAPGVRLWDVSADGHVAPRRGNVRGRGSRDRESQAASEAYGTPSATLATSSTSRFNNTEEER